MTCAIGPAGPFPKSALGRKLVLMKNSEFIFDEPSSPQENQAEREWIGPRHLTGTQAAALGRLSSLAGLRGQSNPSGISYRNKPLLIGPSGSGKTAVVRRLCDLEQLQMLAVNGGGWIPFGAHNGPHTLSVVRRFVEGHAGGGIIFVDEIDKTCPFSGGTFHHSWSLGVFAEILTLLDGDSKLRTADWKPEHVQRLSSFFIVGAGTWQSHASESRKNGQEATCGYGAKVIAQAGIPEEILFRFNASLVELGLPSRKDFSQAIRRLHRELEVPLLSSADEEKAIDNAVGSNCGMRWVEEYLAEMLIRMPRKAAKSGPPKEKKPEKISINRTAFNKRLDSALEVMESSQKTAKTLEVKLLLALQVALHAPAGSRKDFLDPKQLEELLSTLVKAGSGLHYGTSTSEEQRRLRETELHVHGGELLRLLDEWFETKAFAMKACGLLEPALDLYTSMVRIAKTWRFLATVEVTE